jgi:hypothetical protein
VQSHLASDDLLQSLDARDEEVLATPRHNELIRETQTVRLGLGVEAEHRASSRARLADDRVKAWVDTLSKDEVRVVCPCWKEELVSYSSKNGGRVNAHISG